MFTIVAECSCVLLQVGGCDDRTKSLMTLLQVGHRHISLIAGRATLVLAA